MAYKDNSGISLGSSFTLKSHSPLDLREVAKDGADLTSIINEGAYEGMHVYIPSGVSGYTQGIYFCRKQNNAYNLVKILDADGKLVFNDGEVVKDYIDGLLSSLEKTQLQQLKDALDEEIRLRVEVDTGHSQSINTLNETTTDHAKRIESLEEFKTSTEEWKTSHNTEYAEYKASVEQSQKTQNQNITDVNSKASTNAQNITSIQATIGEDDTKGLRKRIKTNETDIDALQEALEELDDNVAEKLEQHTKQLAAEEESELLVQIQALQDCLTWKTIE